MSKRTAEAAGKGSRGTVRGVRQTCDSECAPSESDVRWTERPFASFRYSKELGNRECHGTSTPMIRILTPLANTSSPKSVTSTLPTHPHRPRPHRTGENPARRESHSDGRAPRGLNQNLQYQEKPADKGMEEHHFLISGLIEIATIFSDHFYPPS